MKRKFITNLILLVGLNLMVKPIYLLVVESEIQNRVGPENFGIYFALINFSFILNILLDLGTTNWNTRKIAEDETISSSRFHAMFRLRAMLAAAYFIITLVTGFVLGYNSWELIMMIVLAINQVFASLVLYLRSYLTGLHLFQQDSLLSVLDRMLLLIMMSVLLWGGIHGTETFRIEWLIWGQTASYGITFVIALLMVISKKQTTTSHSTAFNTREVLAESFPFALLILLSMIGSRVDAVMLERISGAEQAGLYAMCFRFFEAVNMVSYLFAVLLLPMFTRLLKTGENIAPLLRLSFNVLFSGAIAIALSGIFFSPDILSLIYDNNVAEATPIFSWLMISAFFFSLQYISGTLITASGKMRPLIWIAFGGMICNIVLNIVLIPSHGAYGAAIASCVSQALIFAIQIMVVVRKFHTEISLSRTLRVALFTALCIIAGACLENYRTVISNGVTLLIFFFLFVLTIAIITGMLNVKKFIALLKTS